MSTTHRHPTNRYQGDEGVNIIEWNGPGWYAQRSIGNDLQTVFIASFMKHQRAVDRAAYQSGYGTPFAADSVEDCI